MKTGSRTYRLGARATGVEQTSSKILQAAIEEFWSAPDPDIRLEAVAARAGVSVQTVLRHFGSKSELMSRAAQWQSARVRASRDPLQAQSPAAAARQLVAHYEQVGDGVLRLLAAESRIPSLAPILEEGRGFHRQWCADAFASALANLPGRERERRLAQLVAVCDVYTWMLIRRQSGLSVAETERAIADLIEPLMKET